MPGSFDTARPLPRALYEMRRFLVELNPGLSVSQDRPKTRPERFIVVDLLGGSEDASGLYMEPVLAVQCYAMNTGDAESLCSTLLAQCKATQFKLRGDVQFRKWTTQSLPHPFPDSIITDRVRWQFSGSMGMSNRKKGID